MTIAFYKPYDVLSQFTKEVESHITLADYLSDLPKDVYPIGRLDRDSEGLLLLSNEAGLNKALLDPSSRKSKAYWVQVDGSITEEALQRLRKGVDIKIKKRQYRTQPCEAQAIPPPDLPPRQPPVRYRKNIPTSWLSIQLTEGKNRQVRRMCAAVGFPVLRLVRHRIAHHTLGSLSPGEYRTI